jgi:DNA repair protein SbcC/Rad50
MRIRLKNFRCYSDETFNFGEDGVVLLSGPSGTGKSTILMGIYFALFGVGTKVTAHNCTSCMVELEFDELKVVRTKRPNRVVVNDIYEDDAAQSIIDKKFGNTFNTTGYIAQNALNSFILMSPLDKLGFLEKFAFKDVNIPAIKAKCKVLINKRNDELVGVNSQLELAVSVLSELKEPKKVLFPIKCKKSQREIAIKNQDIRLKNTLIKIKKANKLIQNKEKEITANENLEKAVKYDDKIINELEVKIKDIKSTREKITYIGDEKLEEYVYKLSYMINKKELVETTKILRIETKKLQYMYTTEMNKLKNDLANIKTWVEYSAEETDETIQSISDSIEDMKKVSRLRKVKCDISNNQLDQELKILEKYRKELDTKNNLIRTFTDIYQCPNCNENLCVRDGSLSIINIDTEIDTEIISEEIIKLKSKIKNSENFISKNQGKLEHKKEAEIEIQNILSQYEEEIDPEELEESLQTMREYKSEQKTLEKERKRLKQMIEQEKFSDSYSLQKISVEKIEQKIEKLSVKSEPIFMDIKEEDIRKEIETQKEYKNRLEHIKEELLKLELTHSNHKKHQSQLWLDHSEKYDTKATVNSLSEDIRKEQQDIKEYKKQVKELQGIIEVIKEWQKYKEDQEKYQEWKDKIDKLQYEEKESKLKYSSITMLKEKILEAESIAILNVIESINYHSQIYLDIFFSESPILVRLVPFKKTAKTTKPQINIEIEYKGMEADLSMLSGGELSRVILAYTLALGEMFNTPLLLLDECTASLDQELTDTVFQGIKENFNGKLVVIIAHQVVTGTFDKTICLGHGHMDKTQDTHNFSS